LQFIYSLLADNNILFPVAEREKGGVFGPNPTHRESPQWLTNGLHTQIILAEAILQCLYFKFDYRVNNRGKYADGLYNSNIDNKDNHMPSPLIMFASTTLGYALLEWQKKKGVHLKTSTANLEVDRPDCSNYFNYNNNSGQNESCCPTSHCMLTLPGVADMYTLLLNSWNTLPESHQQSVYKHSCYSPASDPTGVEFNTCCGHRRGSSGGWHCYTSCLVVLQSGA
jgi:hypothetical protein